VRQIKTAKWHAGRWAAGATVIKLIWNKEGIKLSSGFVVSKNLDETNKLIGLVKKLMATK
jgi:hypothetical protein